MRLRKHWLLAEVRWRNALNEEATFHFDSPEQLKAARPELHAVPLQRVALPVSGLVRREEAARARLLVEVFDLRPRGHEARLVGRVVQVHPGKVVLKTSIGGKRLVDRMSGDMLPRIC